MPQAPRPGSSAARSARPQVTGFTPAPDGTCARAGDARAGGAGEPLAPAPGQERPGGPGARLDLRLPAWSAAFERLRAQISGPPPSPLAAALLALVCVVVAGLSRLALARLLQGAAPFTFYFPALLVSSLWGGRVGGAYALVLAAATTPALFLPGLPPIDAFPALGAFAVAGACSVLLALFLRRAIRALARSSEANEILARELRHRVKNNLAIVEAIATQSARTSQGISDFLPHFRDRLAALAAAHDLLQGDETSPDLKSAAERALAPFDSDRRVTLEGEAIQVPASELPALFLCLHELATNSLKYGALSRPEGKVTLSWQADRAAAEAIVAWVERDGPPVEAPSREGFGSRLLRRGLSSGGGRLEHPPEGLRWSSHLRLR